MPEITHLEPVNEVKLVDGSRSGCITAFYEKVKNVKADVAAVLV
jgi:hypothetical protein